jgi:F-type H+-transporting ATPase subunit epsilon
MADQVEFELVSPERLLLSQPVDMVVVPGGDGDFAVLPGHALLMSTVRSGVIDMYEGDTISTRIFVAGGFAEVTAERCTVLAEEAIPLDDIDRADAESRLKDAELAVDDAPDDDERAAAEAKLEVARALIEALDGTG